MLGVVIMTNPQFVFFWTKGERGFSFDDYPYFSIGVAFSFGYAIFSGLSFLFMRKIGTTVNPTKSNFHFGLVSIIQSVCLYVYDPTPLMSVSDAKSVFLIAVIFITGFSS